VKSYNNFVHYIWVGDKDIPERFIKNYNRAKESNTGYNFEIWTEDKLIPILGEFSNLFLSSTVFHKLQLAKYLVLNYKGGICCDFDIEWKANFDSVYSLFDNCNLIFVRRNSYYSYTPPKKIYLLDDYVILARPGLTKKYIEYCLARTNLREDQAEPFSVYALTEWCLNRDDVKFFDSSQIYDDPTCSLAYHYNQRTWVK